MIISRSVRLRISHFSDKTCGENQNTHSIFNNFFRKSCRLWDNIEKYCRAGQAADDNTTLHAGQQLNLQTHPQNVQFLLRLHYSNGYANEPQG
jgi:hypothetical protein